MNTLRDDDNSDSDRRRALFAPHALLTGGWAENVLLQWDAAGTLRSITPDATPTDGVQRASGPVIPGMVNLHSHAFQRAFAGLTEYRANGNGNADDSFWSWREHMYRFASAITPPMLEDIATQLYIEMLQAGYTAVCEFHYLHHDTNGHAHADAAEMALRIAAAARRAGIGLTLLPVLYQTSGFGAQPPRAEQQRFINSVDALLRIVERLRGDEHAELRVGAAPHSLRAVSPAALSALIDGLNGIDPDAPLHIHIAEQQREVDECIAWSGQRPVHWLLDHADIGARWCLVHATHVDHAELRAVAASRATVGLCPSTEANLGDGVFPAAAYLDAAGDWGIGSDSHACVDAAEELRLLEYGQRLGLQRRNVLASAAVPQVAQRLWAGAVAGGARASSRPVAGLAAGQRADFVVLHAGGTLHGLSPEQLLASHVFARHGAATIDEVWVGGQCRVRGGRHALGDEAQARFVAARNALLRSC